MPTNDDQQQPLITEPAQVTGEYAAITQAANEMWEDHYAACWFCQHGDVCHNGARLLETATGGQGE